MISSIGSQIQAYSSSKIYSSQSIQKNNLQLTSSANQGIDNSKVQSRRDMIRNQIDKVSDNDDAAEELLKNYSKPDCGGVLFAVTPGFFEEKIDTTAIRRMDRINERFNQEFKQVQDQTADIISEGRSAGKKPQEILEDIYSLYDSQSELFKTGRGWDGQLFSISADNPSGFEMTLKYASDVIDLQA